MEKKQLTIKNLLEKQDLLLEKIVILNGWVRFNRLSKTIGFLEVFDGSYVDGIQVVYKQEKNNQLFEKLSTLTLYSAIIIEAKVIKNKFGKIELELENLITLHPATLDFFGKKNHSLEYLREISHLRIKTKLFQAIMKVRSTLGTSINKFFIERDFVNVHSPIITSNDAEGAGESFYVKTKDCKDFFSNLATLTVSGQLHAESYAQALGKVFTFGPTFRAEKSNTTKHASEFWMIEPEATFTDYNQMMNIAYEMLIYVIKEVIKINEQELKIISSFFGKDITLRLNELINKESVKLSYSDAIEELQKAQTKGLVKFENKNIFFGIDLATEHEKYLASNYAKGPIFIYDYPKTIKSFYMYQNDDNKTVRAFDLLVPEIGEIIGGSQREDRYEKLKEAIDEKKISIDGLEWYIDMRKYGYAPSSGFGLGFERLVMYVTNMENIRDVIPFPRVPGKLLF